MDYIGITGGLGFLGKYLINALKNEYGINYKYIIFDVLKKPAHYLDAEYVYCDITNYKLAEKNIKKCKILFHLAGIVSYLKKDISLMEKINVLGTQNICKICVKYKIEMIYASSTSAVGIIDNGVSDELIYPSNVKETINNYSRTKLNAEKIVQKYAKKSKIIIANIAAMLGDNLYFQKLVNSQKNNLVFLFDTYNTFIDVRDAADALVYLKKYGKTGERYIVSSYIIKNLDLQNEISYRLHKKQFKIKLRKKQISFLKKSVKVFEYLFGDRIIPITYDFLITSDLNKRFSNEKLKKIGWKSKYTLSQTISDYLDYGNKK